MSYSPEKKVGLIKCLTKNISPEDFGEFGWMGNRVVKDIVLTFFILGEIGTYRRFFKIPSWTSEYELKAMIEKLKANGMLVETADGIKLSHAPAWLSVESGSALRMRRMKGVDFDDKNVFLNVAGKDDRIVSNSSATAGFSFIKEKVSQPEGRGPEASAALKTTENNDAADKARPSDAARPEAFRKYAFLGDKAVRKIAIAEHVIRAIESGLDISTPDWASDIELEYIISEMVNAGTIIPVGARYKLAEEN